MYPIHHIGATSRSPSVSSSVGNAFIEDLTARAGKLFEKGLTVGTGQCNVKVRGFGF